MKFLLAAVNAKYIHSNPAIYSLRACAGDEYKSYIDLAEYTINQQAQDILADIYKRKPDAIGFSCYIWNWNMVQELLAELPKILPDMGIWLGGPEVTYDAEQVLQKYPQLSGIMVGEGEMTFREVLERYIETEKKDDTSDDRNGKPSFTDIAGLCLSTGYTAARTLTDLSTLPFLYEDLDPFANKIIYYESSRGCPYRCSYCLSSIDKRVRLRDAGIVKKELQFFLDHKVKQVKFVDRTFNCDHRHAMEIWRYIYEHDNGITNFHFEIAADILREEEIELLKKFRPGLAQLEIGVQSTNEETIRAINRRMDVERLEKIVASIREGKNIHQHLDLIAGLPYEDYESFGRSFNRVCAMKPDQLQLGFLKVLKGSEMAEKAEGFGICHGERPPYEVLYTKWLSYGDVLRLKRIEEMVELYYNSNQYTHTLLFLEQAFETPFAMFEKMAEYFEEQGYFVNSPARAYRYQVLLTFAQKYDAGNVSVYQELLTYDLYLRENVKSRPDFCTNMTDASYKEYIRNFYQEEEKSRRFLPSYGRYDWKQLSKMTHLEPFHYPVWDMKQLLKQRDRNSAPTYVLFDYQNRNPLNCEARTVVIDRICCKAQ